MVSRYIDKYSRIIVQHFAPKYIRFPQTDAEIDETKRLFQARHGFPDIIGVLDGTHLEMSGCNRHEEIPLVNRHHTHSVNAQIVCDSRLYITNVNARFPGGTHDNFIFNSSHLKARLERRYAANPNDNFWLLGKFY